VVTGTSSDGTTKVETVDLASISGYNANTTGTQTLTVTVNDKTATFTVTVKTDDDIDGPGLVVAVWGRYLTETTSDLLRDDFIAYCDSEGLAHGDITFRYKAGATSADAFYEVAAFGAEVLAESDVNIVLPVGSNIGTTGGVTLLGGNERKKLLASVGDAGSNSKTRYIGYLTDDELTVKFYTDYIEQDRAKAIIAVNRN
jgi:hypothetical protein